MVIIIIALIVIISIFRLNYIAASALTKKFDIYAKALKEKYRTQPLPIDVKHIAELRNKAIENYMIIESITLNPKDVKRIGDYFRKFMGEECFSSKIENRQFKIYGIPILLSSEVPEGSIKTIQSRRTE